MEMSSSRCDWQRTTREMGETCPQDGSGQDGVDPRRVKVDEGGWEGSPVKLLLVENSKSRANQKNQRRLAEKASTGVPARPGVKGLETSWNIMTTTTCSLGWSFGAGKEIVSYLFASCSGHRCGFPRGWPMPERTSSGSGDCLGVRLQAASEGCW